MLCLFIARELRNQSNDDWDKLRYDVSKHIVANGISSDLTTVKMPFYLDNLKIESYILQKYAVEMKNKFNLKVAIEKVFDSRKIE
jgi:hypothetical protein